MATRNISNIKGRDVILIDLIDLQLTYKYWSISSFCPCTQNLSMKTSYELSLFSPVGVFFFVFFF